MSLSLRQVAVECSGIRLAYGETEVLKDVTLRIEPGEFFALLGPSGSGKSTLLRLIAGFNRHQQGELLVDGRDISAVPPHARDIGMVFQSYALWPHLSVFDNVAFGLVERRVARSEIRRRVAEALETVGLADYAQRRPNQLSGGQQQRVALARTIIIEPTVLLLDEPLSNLDKNLRVQMRQELLALQRRLGITTVFVTHDQEEAMTTADRMAVLDQGVLQQVGSPIQLYDEPVNRFVATFVGTTNLLDGTVVASGPDGVEIDIDGLGGLSLPGATVVPGQAGGLAGVPIGTRLTSCVRPHLLALTPFPRPADGAHGGSAGVRWIDGLVEAAEFFGESIRYRLRVGGQAITADRLHQPQRPVLAGGARVCVGIDPATVRLLAI